MAANPPTNLDKAAILLRRLPEQSLKTVLDLIGKEQSTLLQNAISKVSDRADLSELDSQVLQEFREMQEEVNESVRGSAQLESLQQPVPTAEAPIAPEAVKPLPKPKKLRPVVRAPNPVDELVQYPPEVIAAALKEETNRSTALVLRELPAEFTSGILEKMPPERRQQIFMLLAFKSTVHPDITQKVLQAVAVACQSVDLEAAAQSEQDPRFKTLIGILQKVEREERLRLMEALQETDEELATQIDDNLYDYTDILRVQDRSVQKLLTQLELKVVAMALKTAPEEIVDKVKANLSERVRATLTEEMELLSSFPPAKVDEARKEIANVVRLQDKDGTLQWLQA